MTLTYLIQQLTSIKSKYGDISVLSWRDDLWQHPDIQVQLQWQDQLSDDPEDTQPLASDVEKPKCPFVVIG